MALCRRLAPASRHRLACRSGRSDVRGLRDIQAVAVSDGLEWHLRLRPVGDQGADEVDFVPTDIMAGSPEPIARVLYICGMVSVGADANDNRCLKSIALRP